MSLERLLDRIYSATALRIGAHVLFWIMLLAVRLHLVRITFNVYSGFPVKTLILLSLASVSLIALFYYTLVYALLPRFFLNNRMALGLLAVISLFISYTALDSLAELIIIGSCADCPAILQTGNPAYRAFLDNQFSNIVLKRVVSLGTLFALLFSLCIPLFVKMTLNAYRSSIKSLQLAHQNLRLEFDFLRAQLNPHFLFNSLNNIYGLILNDEKDKSANLVARLSDLLRYMIYQSSQPTMPLEKEIKLMEDYLELEKVRLNYAQVRFSYATDGRDYHLAPLLLMPLLENAFKFAADQPLSRIEASLSVSKHQLQFVVNNGVDTQKMASSAGGIGLMNLKKRLDLYYAGKYRYKVDIMESNYRVTLTLELT